MDVLFQNQFFSEYLVRSKNTTCLVEKLTIKFIQPSELNTVLSVELIFSIRLTFNSINVHFRKIQIEKQIYQLPIKRMISLKFLHTFKNLQVNILIFKHFFYIGSKEFFNWLMIFWINLCVHFQNRICSWLLELHELLSSLKVEPSIS